MGDVKIRYYVTRQHAGRPKWGYWAPCLARRNPSTGKIEPTLMAKLGFKLVDCGEDGPAAWAIAHHWNQQWDKVRRGEESAGALVPHYPPGSLGEAFIRFKGTQTWLGKKPRTREDWERGWKQIEPVFGDVNPSTVALEDVDAWYAALLDTVGVREAHRAMKIWRALWRVAGTLNTKAGQRYCAREADPSLGIRRQTPKARSAIWFEGEAVRLVKQAWRSGYRGLAAALAVAWDTMLSPVDVRSLTMAQLNGDAAGPLFSLDRAKTGRAAIGTLSARAAWILQAYIASLGVELHPDAPIFRTRGGEPSAKGGRPRPPAAYSKDTLSKDFRTVRAALFPGDTRKVSDFRRSGAVEAVAGEVDRGALAGKMANSIDSNRELEQTYLPHNATLVRIADHARSRGRARLREGRGK